MNGISLNVEAFNGVNADIVIEIFSVKFGYILNVLVKVELIVLLKAILHVVPYRHDEYDKSDCDASSKDDVIYHLVLLVFMIKITKKSR